MPGGQPTSRPLGFDGNDYRKRVLAPLLAAGVVSLDDPFTLLGVGIDCDDTVVLRERLVEVVGFWQRERNSPRYKGLVGELVRHRAELEAVLLDPQRRALARLRVQGVRRAQESARSARFDRVLRSVVQRHGGVPRGRLALIERLALREGLTQDALDGKLAAYDVLDDGSGAEPLPAAVRLQVRASLDELAIRGDRARAASLWAFLGLSATASTQELELRHAELVGDNLGRAHDRDKTVHADLLTQVRALLLDPHQRAAYLAGLLGEVQERMLDRVLELAVVDGELWPPDVEALGRECVALGTGLSAEQARSVVRGAAASAGIPVTMTAAPEPCPTCQQPEGRQAFSTPTVLPASSGPVGGGARVQAEEEWRQVEREVGLRRLTAAAQRLQRLRRLAPDLAGPSGALPQQRHEELHRWLTEARAATALALGLPEEAREAALYAVLDGVADLEEATTALATVPVGGTEGLTATLDGVTMRLRWDPPASPRGRTWSVVRVTRDAMGGRVERQLGLTTRCEAVDTDLPRASLVWHEVTAVVGSRRSAVAATEPQPVVPDVHDLRVANDPDGITLTWHAPPGSDVVVERRRLDDPDAPMRRTRARGSGWRDVEVVAGGRYSYVVRVEAAVGGVVARTPGCTVLVTVAAGAATHVLPPPPPPSGPPPPRVGSLPPVAALPAWAPSVLPAGGAGEPVVGPGAATRLH